MNVYDDWLASQANAAPHKTAVLYHGQSWSYAQLHQQVTALCGRLHRVGIAPGQRVAVLLPNTPLYVALIHALARLGTVIVPLNARLTAVEWTWQLEQARCSVVLYNPDSSFRNKGDTPPHTPIPWLPLDESWLLPDANVDAGVNNAPLPLEQPQAILFTSGTSGTPKGAVLTFANHLYSAFASAARLGLHPDDLWLSCLPLYHVGGMAIIWRSCLYGTAVDLHPHFDLTAVNHSLDTHPITLISLVPTMLHRLVASRTHWPASLRLILLGGAAANTDLVTAANALPRQDGAAALPLVATTYGMTETASQVATLLPADVVHKPGSVGRPLPFTRITIADDDGNSLPPNSLGEIVVSGLTVMAGYDGAANPHPGQHKSGDIGYLDDDGDLWMVQRRTDLIVSGGENVYPAEVEQVLESHTAVAAACVVGLPDAEWGQRVAALVVLHPQQTLTPAELLSYCQDRLARYKQPRLMHIVPALPQTASGKIARAQAADILRQSVTGSI
jgi:O-succinylbenzoic acid--CoA ligase